MKNFLQKFLNLEPDSDDGEGLEHSLRVATAVLLVEVARADFIVQEAEQAGLRHLLTVFCHREISSKRIHFMRLLTD